MASSVKMVFCQKNLEKFSQRVYDAYTSKYPDEKVEIKDCAGKDLCSLCFDVPFVIRNGAIVHARDERDLYFKLTSGAEFLTGVQLVDLPPAPPAPPKEPAAAKPAPVAAAKPAEAPKSAEAPKADAEPKLD